MSDLATFLNARLDEDEQAARAAAAANPGSVATHWSAEQVDHRSSTGLRGTAWAVVPERVKGVTIAISPTEIRPLFVTHIARHDPARVLREVEVKRQIVSRARDKIHLATEDPNSDILAGSAGAFAITLRLLALPYADHPDYREEWRP
ncbi:hypothetical protein GCM10010182_67460 [Actinomadura cremea]|nr:hypothetical protein GCM10010182_67460 [Actinomadura cremea]